MNTIEVSANAARIAVVIPFFKTRYLEALLASLSHQTDRRFNVYIGNDNSPEDPLPILEKFRDSLPIRYRHYPDNLGHICPTRQWNRCLALVGDEDWVWMLPDDDLVSDNCIEEFYKALPEVQEGAINVLTIPATIVNADGRSISQLIINPRIQTNYQFYLRQLKGEATGSSLGENIFRRSALLDAGGFISFPRAWGSDHATILRTSANSHIYCLQNSRFGFRQSGINISSIRTDGDEKMAARLKFLDWLKDNEDIFSRKPDPDFYCYFYWKAEHYLLHEWKDSWRMYRLLLQLRRKAIGSGNPLWLLRLIITKRFLSSVNS